MVVVIGDVMVDIVVRPVGPFNKGSDTASRIVVAPGGSATNQAVAFAAAGADVHLVAVVGDDELGHAAARALAATGVHAHLVVLEGQRTGVVVALVDPLGERSMLTDRGANRSLAKRHLAEGDPAKGDPARGPGQGTRAQGTRAQGTRAQGTRGEERSAKERSRPGFSAGGGIFTSRATSCSTRPPVRPGWRRSNSPPRPA